MPKKARTLLVLAAATVCAIGLVMLLLQDLRRDAADRAAASGVTPTTSSTSETQAEGSAEPIAWQADLDGALAQAEQEGKLVLLEYTSDRCSYCARMENDTLSQANIISAVQQFVPVRASPDDVETKSRYGLNSTPSYLALRPDGEVLADYVGYRPAEVFLVELENAIRMDQGKPLERVPTPGFSIGGT